MVPITGQKDETTKVTSGGQTYSMRMCNLKETYLNMSSIIANSIKFTKSPNMGCKMKDRYDYTIIHYNKFVNTFVLSHTK